MLHFCFLEIKSNYIKVKYLQSLDYRELFRIFKKLVFQTQVKKNPTGDLVHECTFSKENKIMNTEFLASQQFRVFDTEKRRSTRSTNLIIKSQSFCYSGLLYVFNFYQNIYFVRSRPNVLFLTYTFVNPLLQKGKRMKI